VLPSQIMARLVPNKILAPLWSAVFNHFSPSLPRHDNYAIIVAIGLYDGGRKDSPDSRDRLGQSCRHYVRSDWSGHLHVGHVGGRQGVHPTDFQVNTSAMPS
jgi:hypothetical protein